LTYSASIEVPSAAAYQLQQQLKLYAYNGSYYTNLYGDNEKWLVAANGIWYALLPNGQLYRWAATMAQTLQAANLVATFDPIFWTYPQLLLDAQPPVAPAITWTVLGNQLTLQRPAGLTGVFLIQVTASDGALTSTPQTFLLTLN
jgi:carbonic anhydrase